VLAKFAKVKHGIRFGGSSSIAPPEKREGSISIDVKDGPQVPLKEDPPAPVAPAKEPLRLGPIVIHSVKSEYELLPIKFSDQLHRVWNVATTKIIGKGRYTTCFPGLGEDGSLGTIQVADVTKIPTSALQLLTHGASVAASIRHRHSVEVYSVTIANDRWLMMASESLPTQSLRTLMSDFMQGSNAESKPPAAGGGGGRHLPLHPIRRYAKEMVDILRFLQANKIVHGALSPSNLLLGSDGSIKLGNYSRSQLLAADSSSSWIKSNDKDRSTSLSAIKESTSSLLSAGSGQRTPGQIPIDITLDAVREGINAEKEVADEYYYVSPEFLQAIQEQTETKMMGITPHGAGPLEDSGREQQVTSASLHGQTLFQVVQGHQEQEDTQTTDKDSTVVDSRNSSSSEMETTTEEGPVKDSLGELRMVDSGTPLTASRAGLTSSAEQQTPQLPASTSNPIHPNTDIYGFGRTLLFLLLGSLPDRKITKKEVESLLRESPRFSQIQLNATASTSVSGAKSEAATFTSLCSLIEMCLSENPRHRPSADQIAHHPFFV
jgi:serine/threonine protein kinase